MFICKKTAKNMTRAIHENKIKRIVNLFEVESFIGISSQFIRTVQFSVLMGVVLTMNQLEKFASSFGIFPKVTQHAACNSFTGSFLNTSHDHAHMGSFYNNTNACRINCLKDSLSYFLGQSFLNLFWGEKYFFIFSKYLSLKKQCKWKVQVHLSNICIFLNLNMCVKYNSSQILLRFLRCSFCVRLTAPLNLCPSLR